LQSAFQSPQALTSQKSGEAWSGSQQRTGISDDAAIWVDRMLKTISPSEGLNADHDFTLDWLKSAIEEARDVAENVCSSFSS
jgi:hypothetical protein